MAPWLLQDDDLPARSVRAAKVTLRTDDVGPPETSSIQLATIAGAHVGVWSIEEGEVRDVEAEEVAVVLSGRATIEIEGMTPLEVGPGYVLSFEAGVATRWIIHERLTKVYITP